MSHGALYSRRDRKVAKSEVVGATIQVPRGDLQVELVQIRFEDMQVSCIFMVIISRDKLGLIFEWFLSCF